jgi:hypothetical protein
MGADDSRVNEQMLHISINGDIAMQFFEDALPAPASESLVDTIPAAVLFGKQTSLCTATGYPQHGFDELATFTFMSDINFRT